METKTTYMLEMISPDEFNPKFGDFPDLRVERMEVKCPEFNKFLHRIVGYNHRWGGHEEWSKDDWYNYVDRDGFETWVAYMAGTPAGYFELLGHSNGELHLMAFGLLPDFIGIGLGGHLLSKAIKRAWEMGAKKVIVGTCSHDHPHAIHNYKARGFKVFRTEQKPANPPIKSFWDLV